MKPGTPKQTGSEKKFDRAKEEAFSNEGAPPPGQVSSLGDDAEVESSNDEPDVKTSGEGAPKSRASLFGLTRSRGL